MHYMKDSKSIRTQAVLAKGMIAFLSVVLLIVLLEFGAKIYIEYFANGAKFKKYASFEQLADHQVDLQRDLHRYLSYIPNPNYVNPPNRHNDLGLRGEEIQVKKPDGIFRIVCIGGSTTYSSGVKDYKKSYPYLLEKELHAKGHENVQVINAGMLAYTSWESLINFQTRLLDLSPDLLVIYNGVNDVYTRLVWPPETYRGDNSGYWQHVNHASIHRTPPFLSHFNLGRIVLAELTGYSMTFESHSYGAYSESNLGYEFRKQMKKGVYPKGVFEEISALEILDANSPTYFRRNLENLVLIAQSNNIATMFASFEVCPSEASTSVYGSDVFTYGIKQHNQIVKEIARDYKAFFYDYPSEFPIDTSLYEDEIHLNEKGLALRSKLFANYIDQYVISTLFKSESDSLQ